MRRRCWSMRRTEPFQIRRRRLVERFLAGPGLGISVWPVALGYLRVVAHPALLGAPLAPEEVAVESIEQFTSRPHVRRVGEANRFWPVYRRAPTRSSTRQSGSRRLVLAHIITASPRSGVTTATRKFEAFKFATPSPADGVGPAAAVDHHGRLHAVSDAILGEQLAESSDFIAAIDQGATSAAARSSITTVPRWPATSGFGRSAPGRLGGAAQSRSGAHRVGVDLGAQRHQLIAERYLPR